ncbi:MAG TPA: trypsin-like peptidase domain-containing protein [Gaiellaceae bacterium]|nr:trypsin-like peptidase domain-containing protein [Gaiellaceae bacterium]
MPRKRTTIATAFAATALAAGGAGGAVVALTHSGGTRTVTVARPQTLQVANVSTALSVADLAKKVTPSVVEIVSTSKGGASPFGQSQGDSQSEGTGWVYDAVGHIVTNEHVVDGASSVKVTFSDGSTATANVVGKDISTDLAVLKVNVASSKLHPLSVANSSDVAVGQQVVAIGNPFGLQDTVTSGIVSALDREIQAPNNVPIEGAIQTDAAINHGNSGGPLFDMSGNVIGVTSQIESDSGGSDGVGFAIPSNLVKTIVPQLISGGSVQHAFLGVSPQTVTGVGVKVVTVESGSAAAKAGLQAGDVITAIDGGSTSTSEALRAAIAQHKPGDSITLSIRRNGATKTLKATLGTTTTS